MILVFLSHALMNDDTFYFVLGYSCGAKVWPSVSLFSSGKGIGTAGNEPLRDRQDGLFLWVYKITE